MRNQRYAKAKLKCNCGQSTVEYVVIVSILMATFMAGPRVSDRLVRTFCNKYESYAFAVAISDPPRGEMDQRVHEVTGRIKEWSQALDDVELPGKIKKKIPGTEAIEHFLKKLGRLF